MKRVFFVGMMILGLMSASQVSAQNKTAYISIDEVVQMMPEYKKHGRNVLFDSALQINYAETERTNRQDSMFKSTSKWSNAIVLPIVRNEKLLTDLYGF
jgi:hypothetical protein